MITRLLLAVLALFFGLNAGSAHAAFRMQAITPLTTSVFGGETRDYTVRLFDSGGTPIVGETVRFSNDACGQFQNSALTIDVVSDGTGRATATFRARHIGIGCWITVSASPASVRFNVFTYTETQIYFKYSTLPANPKPGDEYTLIAGAFTGVYPIYDAQINIRTIDGTGKATLNKATANSGRSGEVEFEVQPTVMGDYEVELELRGVKRVIPVNGRTPLQDMWWAGTDQNGWGMSVVQHGDRLFAVIYAYDASGNPIWYVMPAGAWDAARTQFTGALYVPTGSPYSAYDATKLVAGAPVGTASLEFGAEGLGVLRYNIGNLSGLVRIERQMFGPKVLGVPITNLGDMWWGGPAQNGWGIAVLQQYASLFSVWFTYGASGAPTWFVMPAGEWTTPTTYEGRLYRTKGSPWAGRIYDAAALQSFDVGTFKFTFAGDAGTFDYVIDGVQGTMPLVKQGF